MANGRWRFSTATRTDWHLEAETCGRRRVTSLAVIRQMGADSRRMFLSDLPELGRRSFHEMQMVTQILSHFSPNRANRRTRSKGPIFGEVALPGSLRNYPYYRSTLGAFLKPNQPTANCISRELARGKLDIPSYTPYIVPDLSGPGPPWPVPIAEHSAG